MSSEERKKKKYSRGIMKTTTFALLSSVLLGSAVAQGVTDKITPNGAAPAGCSSSFSSKFEIAVVDVTTTSKRDTVYKVSS